ncbi:zf-HC2 domain-containing protein [Bacillus shivajii]|uniref:anti-sigma factor family protein n=1 Tax=Bacillus shivajii TaxID=1983719 RepID=UPI001CFC0B82|nr:zf-HC2 domain-containing protein [Bacillus shivajii]UCZ53526.1 zf-HC2 domain-containing protein [Bacillus shivajii]
MKHRSKGEWLKFVNGELPDETRQEFEDHLFTCDACMNLYIEAIEESSRNLPSVNNEKAFTDSVMSKVETDFSSSNVTEQEKTNRPFYQKTAFHYVVAASLTIVLMSSGVFQSITSYVDDLQRSTLSEESPSITAQILDRAFSKANEGGVDNE